MAYPTGVELATDRLCHASQQYFMPHFYNLAITNVCIYVQKSLFIHKTWYDARASEMVRQVRQEPYHFLASGQLQFSPDYKAGSKRFRAIMKEACNHIVYYI